MHFYSNVENKKVESIILLFIQRLFPHNINCKGGVPGEKKEKKKYLSSYGFQEVRDPYRKVSQYCHNRVLIHLIVNSLNSELSKSENGNHRCNLLNTKL